jgi:hypothetical protein
MNDPELPPADGVDMPHDETARIIANLVALMGDSDMHFNATRDAIAWLRRHDHPRLLLRASVRDMMVNAR